MGFVISRTVDGTETYFTTGGNDGNNYMTFNTFYETYKDARRWGVSQAEAYRMMEGKTGLTKNLSKTGG